MSRQSFAKRTRRLLGRFDRIDYLLQQIEGSAVMLRSACIEAPDGKRAMPSAVRLRRLKYRTPSLATPR